MCEKERDEEALHEAFRPWAEFLAMDLEGISDAAIRVANASIVRAMQIVSTERGKDPRDHALVAFGGAGPLHAAHVAADLGMTTVIVPPHAGVLSAYGLIASDYQQFSTVTRKMLLDDAAPGAIAEIYRDMRKRAIERFVLMGLGARPRISFFADMRFVGQAFEVAVPVDPPSGLTASDLRTLFADEHHRVFMHGGDASGPIEIVAFRLGVTAPLDEVPALKEEPGDKEVPFTPWRYHDHGGWRDGVIGRRSAMAPDTALAGPALIEDDTATIVVPKGWSAARDRNHNLVLTRAA